MAYTEAQKRATIKYLAAKTDEIKLRLPKGTKDYWKEAAAARGISVTQLIIQAVEDSIKKGPGS